MSQTGVSADLTIPLYIEAEIECEPDGALKLVLFVFKDDDDDATEAQIDFEEVIENVLQLNEDEGDFRQLYNIAHELRRYSDRLFDTASRMEGTYMNYDLFDQDDDQA